MTQQILGVEPVTETEVYRLAQHAIKTVNSRDPGQVSEILDENHGWIWQRRNMVVVGREPTVEKMNVIYHVIPDPTFYLVYVIKISDSTAVIYWAMEGYCPSLKDRTKIAGIWIMALPSGILYLTFITQEGGKTLKEVKDLDTQQKKHSKFSLFSKGELCLDVGSTSDDSVSRFQEVGPQIVTEGRSPGGENGMNDEASKKVEALVAELTPDEFLEAAGPIVSRLRAAARAKVRGVALPANAIRFSDASRKYNVTTAQLVKYVERGEVSVVARPSRGFTYLDEDEVAQRVANLEAFREEKRTAAAKLLT